MASENDAGCQHDFTLVELAVLLESAEFVHRRLPAASPPPHSSVSFALGINDKCTAQHK